MTKTRRQKRVAAAGNRGARGERRFSYAHEEHGTPRSRRRYQETSKRSKAGRGFAAMDPKKQRKIASLGGRSFHRWPRGFAAMGEKQRRKVASQGGSAPHHKPRGFAAMGRTQQREIAARGGRAPRHGPRGFAAMRRGQQRAIAARGGRASHSSR